MRTCLLALSVLALAVPLAGCEASFSIGSSGNLNTDKAETEIAKGIEEQTGIDSTVTCPDDVKLEKGDTFTCTTKATSDGSTAEVKVTQTDGEGRIDWKLDTSAK